MGRKFYLLLTVLVFSVVAATAQTGEIKGKVFEEGGKEPVPFASVAALLNGVEVIATSTDFDGNYTLKPLSPGKYDVKITSVGFQSFLKQGVLVSVEKTTFVDGSLGKGVNLTEFKVEDYAVPLIDIGLTTKQQTITFEEIQSAPTRSLTGVITQAAGTFQKDENSGINIRGSRDDATAYYIDGIKVRGNPGLPQVGTEQVTVITGGIPAQYGDATGGIISITTRGPSSEFGGDVEGETSQFLDAYGHNLGSVSFTGPIYSKKDSTGKRTQSIAGFFISADYEYNKDPDPSVIPAYKVKDDILRDVQENPLVSSPTGAGFIPRASYFTADSFETQKYRENVGQKSIRVSGKIDIHATKNVTLTVGGSGSRDDSRLYTQIYSLMNYANNSQQIETSWRGFANLTQRFNSDNTESAASSIKNAYYTLHVDYSQNNRITQNADHKKNYFDYGYVGSFKSTSTAQYQGTLLGTDTISLVQIVNVDTNVAFVPGTQNPITANYTSEYFNLTRPFGTSFYNDNLSDVDAFGGLLNGDNRVDLNVYGLWATPGRVANQYAVRNNSQARITASGSADIGNHNIIVGLEYEQRTDKGYTINPNSLWTLARQLSNVNLQGVEESSAVTTTVSNGTNVVIFKNYVHGNYVQAQNKDGEYVRGFYENFRDRFGIDYRDTVQTDAYAPSQFSLDMFTPDELFNSGNGIVDYWGYDYLGNKTGNEKWDLNDFYVDKDENNNFLRRVDAFRPTYVAGYIQDKFNFNDIKFDIGLRIDRFDANQKVLKDPYLLYDTRTAGDDRVKALTNGTLPDGIGNDFYAYVDNAQTPTKIVGYRSGNVWYDANGNFTTDINKLTQGSGSAGGIQPFLSNYEEYNRAEVNPNAFKDYDPQVNYMPRVAFSFPISDEAYFSAHYDVLTQRPQNTDLIRFNPISYLGWAQGVSSTFSNPDLKPERTTEYEINFQQKLSRSSSFSISAFYKQLRDQIQIVNYDFAFPIKYSAFGNLDFGTVKGLTFNYDLRRTSNVRMTIAYTLQFADGTGSDEFSSQGILTQAGQSNLREIKPLGFDQRHTFVTSFDFRYAEGKDYTGPVWGNTQVFANAGLNVVVRAGSGTPYTRKSNITPEADFTTTANSRKVIQGSINGSRFPWTFRIDTKIDKDIKIRGEQSESGNAHKPIYANIYLRVLNILNTRNITNVYSATGSPEDDGYISSPGAQITIASKESPQAYIDQYRIAVDDPANYSLPRRIQLGLSINF